MRKMKKWCVLFITAAMLVGTLAGCSVDEKGTDAVKDQTEDSSKKDTANGTVKDSKKDGKFKIGIAAREITNDYNRNIVAASQELIEKAGGSVVIADAQADVQKHNENIENLINSGIDGLIVHLGDPEQMAPLMAEAEKKGIPVITNGVGSPVEHTLGDVNGDDPLMATLASDALLASIGYKGDVYVVWVPGAPLLETRKRIFEAVAADYPDVKIHEVPAEHNPAKVQTQIEEILTANPEKGSIAGIFGTYDQLVSGASEAIRRAGRGEEIKMIGIDGDVLGFQMLFQEDSPFISTVVMDTESIGQQSADILLGVMDGSIDAETISPKIPASCYVATRKNGVEAAEMKWGEKFWEDAGLVKEDVEKTFPKEEDVIVSLPSIP
ncbi:substrate-binding domain-containing protein [[Clostridium] hylemonae]|uniref:substrate-binding domain-containing protein n=1 Tax=[Clostridium] hylemonae TaxID=89153 RepID=UPI00148679FC|nr:substrate-binding domain-containing protein [[Clostridium] hylemonae]MCB7520286.1 substrate-binding domain-containing protein [[Clostridium] hylemonae]